MNELARRLAVVISLALLAGLIPAPPASRAQAVPPQAGVVVRFGDGSVRTACVDLGEDGTATGEQVLRASGLAVTIAFDPGAGAAVCKIEADGCDYPREGCFCQCTLAPGQPCRYWSYYQQGPNGWVFSNQGSSTYTVRAGAVEGWSWGPGGVGQGVEPPLLAFAEICSVAAGETSTPTPSATATASATPSATATATVAVAPTSAPVVATPTPMIMPVPSRTPPPPPPARPARTATPTSTVTPFATATAQPMPTDTPPPVATVVQALPTALPSPSAAPSAPPTEPTEPLALDDPSTLTPTATVRAAPAGGVVATATAASLRLPMVAAAVAATLPATPIAAIPAGLPTVAAPPAGADTGPEADQGGLTGAATAPVGGGARWFLLLSVALAAGLVLARLQRRR